MTKNRKCVFPGTFDPITKGHVNIINRSLDLFDEIIIAIGKNAKKQPLFSTEQRIKWMETVFKEESKISVETYKGLTTDFCRQKNATYILRGIRTVADFEYEKAIADMNKALASDVETVFLTASPLYATMSSTLVRDVYRNHGDINDFVPKAVQL